MNVEELQELLHDQEVVPPSELPNAHAIALAGQGRRRRRSLLMVSMAAGVTALVVVVSTLVAQDPTSRQPTSPDHSVSFPTPSPVDPDQLEPYARQVLDHVPDARQIGPYVVVPPFKDPTLDRARPTMRLADVPGRTLAIDAHMFTSFPASAGSASTPSWLTEGLDPASNAFTDLGRITLACLPTDSGSPDACALVPTTPAGPGTQIYWGSFGESDRPVLGMGSYPWFGDDTVGHLELGTVPGTDVGRVVLTMPDGTNVAAELDRGRVMPGATVFWAVVPDIPETLTTYDAAGHVQEREAVTPCPNDNIWCFKGGTVGGGR